MRVPERGLRAGELFQLLSGKVSGRVRGGELRRAAKDTGPEPFWDAVEAITTTLRVRERVSLARSLVKSRHLARERRVLKGDEPSPGASWPHTGSGSCRVAARAACCGAHSSAAPSRSASPPPGRSHATAT
jgi:hypothetical protein